MRAMRIPRIPLRCIRATDDADQGLRRKYSPRIIKVIDNPFPRVGQYTPA